MDFFKKLVLFSLVIALIFILSCSGMFQKGKETPMVIDVHTGTDGLAISFEQNMPPDEIYQGGEFQIGTKISNRGAFNVENGVAVVSGYDPNYFFLGEYQKTFSLEGRSLYFPSGAENVLVFTGRNNRLPEGSDSLPSTFIVSVCYKYQTQATQDVCISSEGTTTPTQQEGAEKACTPQKEYSLSGQGAPVAVSLIKVKTMPGTTKTTLIFDISAENRGGGNVRATNAYQKDCIGPALTKNEIDVVGIRVFLGKDEVVCNQNTLKLGLDETKKSPNYVSCKIDVDKAMQDYLSPLTVYLDYGYSSTATKSITVKRE